MSDSSRARRCRISATPSQARDEKNHQAKKKGYQQLSDLIWKQRVSVERCRGCLASCPIRWHRRPWARLASRGPATVFRNAKWLGGRPDRQSQDAGRAPGRCRPELLSTADRAAADGEDAASAVL